MEISHEGEIWFYEQGSEVCLSFKDKNHYSVEKLYTPSSEVGRGQARKLLERVTHYADEHNLHLSLVATPFLENRLSALQLKNFYEKFDFEVEKNFSDERFMMARKPFVKIIGNCWA